LNAPGNAYSGTYMLDMDMTNNNIDNAYSYGAAMAEHGDTKSFDLPVDLSSILHFSLLLTHMVDVPMQQHIM